MTGVRFADVQARPAEFLNLTSLTLEEFEVLVAPFEAAFQGRRGASMGNREPLHRLPDLPAGNAGRSPVFPAHLPEDLRRSSGPRAAVRHEPEQSQPVDPCPAAGVARDAARPRRCPRPLPHGSGAQAGCLGGGTRAAGGAIALPSLCTRRWAGLPPFAHDGTERRIVRPQDSAEQTDCYSGKKKDHTVKNILLVNALLIILFLSDTVGGRIHDKRLAEATPYPLPAGSRLLQDLGFMAFTLPQVEILMPTRKPPGADLSPAQQRANQALHSRRLRIEHVNSSVKRCRVVKDRIRLWKQGVRDVVMEICCALHNFRVRLTPWQPMV